MNTKVVYNGKDFHLSPKENIILRFSENEAGKLYGFLYHFLKGWEESSEYTLTEAVIGGMAWKLLPQVITPWDFVLTIDIVEAGVSLELNPTWGDLEKLRDAISPEALGNRKEGWNALLAKHSKQEDNQ